MRELVFMVVGGLMMSALISCSTGSPTAPASSPLPPSPASSPAPTPPSGFRFAGVVIDDGDTPVPGAALIFHGNGATIEVTSDSNGTFSADVPPWQFGLEVSAKRTTFEDATYWLSTSQGDSTSKRIRIHRVLAMTPGDSTHLSVGPGDASCGFDFEFLCRRIRVRSSAGGMLTLEVTPDRSDAQLGIVPSTDFFPALKSARYGVHVGANAEVAADVLLFWTSPRSEGFTVRSQLVPDQP